MAAKKKQTRRIKKADKDFAKIYNDTDNFKTIKDVANELGITTRTVANRASVLRTQFKEGETVPELTRPITGGTKAPMSEDQSKLRIEYTKEDCIAELRRVAEEHPDMMITRNFFRVNGNISESTWNRYFGTFEEFKRAAGIKLTRQQHAVERSIAKHASVDHYRKLNIERADYEGKYNRENSNRFKTILIGSDLHDKEVDPFFLRVFLDTAKRIKPDVVCLNGDIFDLPEFGKYNVDPREWDVTGRVKFVHKNIFDPLRKVCPDAQIDFIEGNHENRIMRHLGDETPAMMGLLGDLHGHTVSSLLGLDAYEINYHGKADLATFTKGEQQAELKKNYKIYWDSAIAHHFPQGRTMGMPGWHGHHHKHLVWNAYNPMHGSYEWHQIGCGHKRNASYCEGERWALGFLIANIDTVTRTTNFDYVEITDFAVSGGKWYYRNPSEMQPDDRIVVEPEGKG